MVEVVDALEVAVVVVRVGGVATGLTVSSVVMGVVLLDTLS